MFINYRGTHHSGPIQIKIQLFEVAARLVSKRGRKSDGSNGEDRL